MQKTNLKTLTLITADKGYEEAMKRPGEKLFIRIYHSRYHALSVSKAFCSGLHRLTGATFDTDDGGCIMIHTDKTLTFL
jgi:hypothetical protein